MTERVLVGCLIVRGKDKMRTAIGCCVAGAVILGVGVVDVDATMIEAWESKGTNDIELMVPAAVVSNAMVMAKALSNRVEWSAETQERLAGFRNAIHERETPGSPCNAGDRLEGFIITPEDYIPSEAEEATNAYLGALLLLDKSTSVRTAAMRYLSKVIARSRSHAFEAMRAKGAEALFEDLRAGKYDPPWMREVVLPLMKGLMFDDDTAVRGTAVVWYCTYAPRGVDEVLVYATKNPTSAWARERWADLYHHGMSSHIPAEEVARAKETVDRDKAERQRKLDELSERYRRLQERGAR